MICLADQMANKLRGLPITGRRTERRLIDGASG